jgi:hypothetical protein
MVHCTLNFEFSTCTSKTGHIEVTKSRKNDLVFQLGYNLPHLFIFFVDVVIVIVSAFDFALREELAGIWLFVVAAALEGH